MLMEWEQKLCILEYSCRCVAVVMFINKSLINGMTVDFIVVDFMWNILIILNHSKDIQCVICSGIVKVDDEEAFSAIL